LIFPEQKGGDTCCTSVTEPSKIFHNYLRPKGFRIEIGNEPESNRNYLVYEGAEELYKTNNPKELLIKVAQLMPDSEVQIITQDIQVGDEKISQDTLEIHIHYQIPE